MIRAELCRPLPGSATFTKEKTMNKKRLLFTLTAILAVLAFGTVMKNLLHVPAAEAPFSE